MKNKFRFENDLLIIVVEKRNGKLIEYKLDASDFGILSGIGKKFASNGNKNLYYSDNKKQFLVKDFILGFPENRVTAINKDNTDLRKSNLKYYGIRNKYHVEGDTLFIEVQNGEQVQFDVEDLPYLESLDARFSLNNHGYSQVKVDGQKIMLHRFVMELRFGDELAGKVVDHCDGNPRNNKKSNLRIVTRGENGMARHQTRSKTGFPHITELPNGKWFVGFAKFPQKNRTLDTVFEALRYSHIIHEVMYGENRGTIASYENLIKSIKNHGGKVNE
jgi:hypothetical protein